MSASPSSLTVAPGSQDVTARRPLSDDIVYIKRTRQNRVSPSVDLIASRRAGDSSVPTMATEW